MVRPTAVHILEALCVRHCYLRPLSLALIFIPCRAYCLIYILCISEHIMHSSQPRSFQCLHLYPDVFCFHALPIQLCISVHL